jgi:hypothetical protein
VPTSSIDTFFACSVILAAALISTIFVGSTLQLQINDSQNINKQSYLKALANNIITGPGTPANWGTTNTIPSNFGLATSSSLSGSEVDINKINRLGGSSLPYSELATSTNLYNIAFGLKVSQILEIDIQQLSNNTENSVTTFALAISTSINYRPTSASLQAYAKTNSFLTSFSKNTLENGTCNLSVEISKMEVNNALLVVFAQSNFDSRITSFAIYNFNSSTQEFASDENILSFKGPINGQLTWTSNSSSLTIEKGEIFSYRYAQYVSVPKGATYCSLPAVIDPSPQIIILNGQINGNYFQTWTPNPRIPLQIGSNFSQSERNIFSYLITIKGNLYKIEISFGDPMP